MRGLLRHPDLPIVGVLLVLVAVLDAPRLVNSSSAPAGESRVTRPAGAPLREHVDDSEQPNCARRTVVVVRVHSGPVCRTAPTRCR